jgi:hypothetical protein
MHLNKYLQAAGGLCFAILLCAAIVRPRPRPAWIVTIHYDNGSGVRIEACEPKPVVTPSGNKLAVELTNSKGVEVHYSGLSDVYVAPSEKACGLTEPSMAFFDSLEHSK